MSRDNFTQHTKWQLAQAANNHCVRPGCARLTHCFNPATNSMEHIGAAAHDSGAAPGGARFNPDLSPEQRKAYGNGAWLCMACATLVDRLEDLYPPGLLANWQRNASDILLGLVQHPVPNFMVDFKEVRDFAKRFCDCVAAITLGGNSRFDPSLSWQAKCRIDALCQECLPYGRLYCVQYAHTANLQKRVVDGFSAIRSEMSPVNHNTWWFDQEMQSFQLVRPFNQEERAAAQVAADRVCTIWGDIQTAIDELRDFTLGQVSSNSLAGW